MMLAAMAGFDPHDPASADIPVEDYLFHLEASDGMAQLPSEYLRDEGDELFWFIREGESWNSTS